MPRVVTFTVKIEDDKRDLLREYCNKSGIKIQKFLGNAILHEVERETMKEDLMIYQDYMKNGKKTARSYSHEEFSKEMGYKTK